MFSQAIRLASALLIPALWFAEPPLAHALQVVEATDGVTVEAVLAIKEPTRIRIDGAAITNVFGNIYSSNCGSAAVSRSRAPAAHRSTAPQTNPAGEIVLECDADKGEIYVRPVGGLGKPVNLFISSQHATYTLLLRRSDTPADTIVIRDRTPGRPSRPARVPSASRQSIHIRSLKAMLTGDGFRSGADRRSRRRSQSAHPALARARFALTRVYEGRGLDRRALHPDQHQQPEHGAGRAGVRPRDRRRAGGLDREPQPAPG
jgi:conjugal transfer pilus assembly protein TraK